MSVPYSKTEVQLTRNKQQNTIKNKCKDMKKISFVVFVFLCFVVGLLPSSSLTQMQQWEKFALLAGRSWEVPTTSNQPSRRPWAPLVKCQQGQEAYSGAGLLNGATLSEAVRGKYKCYHKYEYKYITNVESTAICGCHCFLLLDNHSNHINSINSYHRQVIQELVWSEITIPIGPDRSFLVRLLKSFSN